MESVANLVARLKQADDLADLALLLGPGAGRCMWHANVLEEFTIALGAVDLTSAAWASRGHGERAQILRDCFRFEPTQAGSEALSLLACVLGMPSGPRIYWPDPLDILLRTMVDTHHLPWCRPVKLVELSEPAIAENLRRPETRVVDLGAIVLPVDVSNGQVPASRIHELLRERLLEHQHVLMWGWTNAMARLAELLPPTSFDGNVGIVESAELVNANGYAYRRGGCLLNGGPLSEADRAEAVIDVLRQLCPTAQGVAASGGVSPGLNAESRPDAQVPEQPVTSTGLMDNVIMANVAEGLHAYIKPDFQVPGRRILGLVLNLGVMRSALAAALCTHLPSVEHLRVDQAADLEMAASIQTQASTSARAVIVLESSAPLSEADVRAYMATGNDAYAGAGPLVTVLMPSGDATWTPTDDVKIENLQGVLPRMVQNVLNEIATPRGVPERLTSELARWVCTPPGSTPFQLKLHRLAVVFDEAEDAVLTDRLAELTGVDTDFAPAVRWKASVELRKNAPVRLRKRTAAPVTVRLTRRSEG